jgi:adenylate cyclase
MGIWLGSAEGESAVKAPKCVDHSNLERISADLIQAQLERIIASGSFDASRRNRLFALHCRGSPGGERADRIKAYTIATSVLGRAESFDAQSDPIVRIEASRLRRSLERYYLMARQDDPIRIDIPKWGYVPSFHRVQSARVEAVPPPHAPEPTEGEPPPVAGQPEARTTRAGNLTFLTSRRMARRIIDL